MVGKRAHNIWSVHACTLISTLFMAFSSGGELYSRSGGMTAINAHNMRIYYILRRNILRDRFAVTHSASAQRPNFALVVAAATEAGKQQSPLLGLLAAGWPRP